MATIPRIRQMEDISQIKDLVTAYDVMEQLGLDTSTVSNLNEALTLLKISVSQDPGKPQRVYNEKVGVDRLIVNFLRCSYSHFFGHF